MKQIYCHVTLLCLLFGVVYSCPESEMTATYTTDARWRIASGFDLSRIYTMYSNMQDKDQRLPLVSINASSENEDLLTLMEGVCELVTFYEHVSRTNSGSQLHTLLTANVKDSCQWLDYLVSNHPDVTGSNDFSNLPTSCSPTNTTRLHHYCLQMKVRGDQLRILTRHTSDALHTYFRGAVPLSNDREWIESSSIPAEQQSRILSNI